MLLDCRMGGGGGREIVVDLFAGGGGASCGIREALGRDLDVAVNHNRLAIAMHEVNHPGCWHIQENVWNVPPTWATKGRAVALLWASPDCTHFSRAKGAAPTRDDKIRSLACVLVDKWIPEVHPRIVIMENVEEFVTWGPLDNRGRIIPERAGETYRWFLRRLRRLGYRVDSRVLRACDYGAPTIRKRWFLIARRDSLPIVWPDPTHGDPASEAVLSGRLRPWRTAAECIDWSVPCPSIFERKRPLADNTLRRIAKGLERYVVNHPNPFIVNMTHGGRLEDANTPLRTITCAHRGEKAIVAPYLIKANHGYKYFRGNDIQEPLRTVTANEPGFALTAPYLMTNTTGHAPSCAGDPVATLTTGRHQALVPAFLAKHYTGVVGSELERPIGTVTSQDHHSLVTAHLQHDYGCSVGASMDDPVNTVTAGGGGHQALVASSLLKFRGTCRDGQDVREPAPTITARGNHVAEVRAFLVKYFGTAIGQDIRDPAHTVTAKARFGLVTVCGVDYQIADIGLRMLQPRELFRAQGFPDSYIIDFNVDGRPLTKTAQVRLCGNSVCPPMAAALVRANVKHQAMEAAG
jgi:DNA (cytosine-5)-methyltransferase 1